MHQASLVDATSDSVDDGHVELRDDSDEVSLSRRQTEAQSIVEDMRGDLSVVEEEPREIAEISGHLQAEPNGEVFNAENVLDPMDVEVKDETDRLEEDVRRPKVEVIASSRKPQEHAETSRKESEMDFNFAIEDLKQELRRPEEENRTLKSYSYESSQVVHDVLPESAGMEVEGCKLKSEYQQHQDKSLELVAEIETLKVQLQVSHDSHAQLESETVTLRQEKEDKVSRLSSQIVDLRRQLHELKEEHSSALVKNKDLESSLELVGDEKTKLKGQVASILEDRRKKEEDLVGLLTDSHEHVHALKVEQRNFLSTIETSNAAMRQLEEQNAAMSSDFDQQKQTAKSKISDLVSELQITQGQQNELKLQLQSLREEHTHVMIKASKLDQLVEELKSDKLRLSSELERLAQARERREEELEDELRTCREHVQSLEVEKVTSGTLVENLNSQVRVLEEDNRQLTSVSNEASQSVQHLWEENTRLIEGYNRLEQEKQAHEGERMELVAGIQTVWEQLHAANDREALLASELRELGERRDAEEAFFNQKVKDLESQLQVSAQERSDLSIKAEEKSQVLENLRLETSQAFKDLQDKKDQLFIDFSELVKQKEETEQVIYNKQVSWEAQVQDLESGKASAMTMVEDLGQQLQSLREKIREFEEKDVKSNLLIQELREEITRLSSEIDKLEEVKERQEGERLELAAELQAAWDQIQAVRDSESNLATDLSELKDLRNEEKIRSDGLIQELRQHIQELEEKMSEAAIKVEQLSKRLNGLRKEQELQDENERLTAEIVLLEQEKDMILTERAALLGETQTLQGRVESLEFDKNKMASEIEELNQWLQGPAAEKKQLAANLDEMTQLFKGLELERNQLAATVSELQEEREKTQKGVVKLQDLISVLEEEKANSQLAHEDLIQRLESFEEEKQQAVKIKEDFVLLVQNLNEKTQVLEEESIRMVSMRNDLLLRIQGLEEEKAVIEKLLEEQSVGLNQLRMGNKEQVDVIVKLEGELEGRQKEVQLLKNQVLSLEEESLSMKTVHETVHSELLAMKIEKSQGDKSVEEFTYVNSNLMEQVRILESEKESYMRLGEEAVSMGEEKSQLQQSLEESGLLVQGLHLKNSELSETLSRLEKELMKKHDEFQRMSGCLSNLEIEKEKQLSQYRELLARFEVMEEELLDCSKSLGISKSALENLQAENLEHITKANLVEGELERRHVEVQKLEEQMKSLSTVHQDTILQLQVLAEQKVEHSERVRMLEEEVAQRQAEMQRPEEKVGSLSSVCEDLVLQLQVLGDELVNSVNASNFPVQELQAKNEELRNTVKILEDQVVRTQAEVQRLEEHAECLSTAHQGSPLQLQALREDKDELTKALEVSNVAFQNLQAQHVEHVSKVDYLEEKLESKLAEMKLLEKEVDTLSTAHQGTLLQLHFLEEEKIELVKGLDGSNLSVHEPQENNEEHSERVRVLEEEVAQKQVEVHRLEEETQSLSKVHEGLLFQLQRLELQKSTLTNHLQECESLIQKLNTENSEMASAARSFEELHRRREKIESLDLPVHSLDDEDFKEASEYFGAPIQGQALEEEAKVARSVEDSNIVLQQSELNFSSSFGMKDEEQIQLDFLKADKVKGPKLLKHYSELSVKKLESENMERATAIMLEEHLHDESQNLKDQLLSLKSERETFEQEYVARLQCLEEEKSHLGKALEESHLAAADRHTEIDSLAATVLDLGNGKDELTKQFILLQEQTDGVVAEREQLSSEVQGMREELQLYVDRLQESENVAKRSREEALELAKQLETFREQVVKNKKTNQSRQLETLKQSGSTPKRNRDLVTDLEPALGRQRLSFGEVEVSHLIAASVDSREELQRTSLGWVEFITIAYQELAKLLRSVGEENEKLPRKQGMSNQDSEVLTNLCQELDRLMLGVREKTEGFAVELSSLKHKLVSMNNESDFLVNHADLDVDNYQQIPTGGAAENRELMEDVESSFQKLSSSHVENTELEAHVANLSSCLEDSQVQLKALVIKTSTGNPYLLTSRADDGGNRKGLACFSADGNCVLNYGSELKVGRSIKAIEQEKREKKGNATLPTFPQRTQTPSRSFKKCKVNMQQQPKRRWIF